jgi:hypothetical protein
VNKFKLLNYLELVLIIFICIYFLNDFVSRGQFVNLHKLVFENKLNIFVFFSAFYLAYKFRYNNRISFLMVFVHELYHSVIAIITLSNLYEFKVTEKEGHIIRSENSFFNITIIFAPYILPLIPLIIFVFFKFIVSLTLKGLFIKLYLVAFGFYFARNFHQCKPIQPDLKHFPILISYTLVLLVNLTWLLFFLNHC